MLPDAPSGYENALGAVSLARGKIAGPVHDPGVDDLRFLLLSPCFRQSNHLLAGRKREEAATGNSVGAVIGSEMGPGVVAMDTSKRLFLD